MLTSLFLFFSANPLGKYLARILTVVAGVLLLAAIAFGIYHHFNKIEKENTVLQIDTGLLAGKIAANDDAQRRNAAGEAASDKLDQKVIADERVRDTRTAAAVKRIERLVPPVDHTTDNGPGLSQAKPPVEYVKFHAAIIDELWSGHCLDVNPGAGECPNTKPTQEAT